MMPSVGCMFADHPGKGGLDYWLQARLMVAGIAGWHISRDFTLDSYIAVDPKHPKWRGIIADRHRATFCRPAPGNA